MSFSVQFHSNAVSDLERIDKKTGQRILSKLRWFAENFESLSREPLAGHLKGVFKVRVGQYQAIYSIDSKASRIVIHRIGHRSEIYR